MSGISSMWPLKFKGDWIEPYKQNKLACSASSGTPTSWQTGDEDQEGVPKPVWLSSKHALLIRRSVLGPSSAELLQSIPSSWQAEASQLLSAWDQAVRASSAIENWHSIVRPHLAVYRTLSAGMLALLAVKHNHQIAPRGLHEGLSPL